MKKSILAIVQIIVMIIVFLLVNYGFTWLINESFVPMFEWFNQRSFWIKILILFIGGVAIFQIIATLYIQLVAVFSLLINRIFPYNKIVANIIAILAIIFGIVNVVFLWRLIVDFNFWTICEAIMISIFILGCYFVLVPIEKQKVVEDENN